MDSDRDAEYLYRFGTNAKSKSRKSFGSFYANSIQNDDYFIPVHFLNNRSFAELPFILTSTGVDDSYRNLKRLNNLMVIKSSVPFGVYNSYNYPQSNHAILNTFRSDFEDFSSYQDKSLRLNEFVLKNAPIELETPLQLREKAIKFKKIYPKQSGTAVRFIDSLNLENNPEQSNKTRFSNPIVLRRSTKSSMVTYQAFQKVFKLRYEEGRAHVRLTDFANSAVSQPYTTERKIKYDKTLGKTKIRYFNTQFNNTKYLPIFNNFASLSNSLNFFFFDFPFLDGVTNDPMRHVWFDTFVKYAQREVSGSSVSKYTIAGVPFFKKKFDFNLKRGKKLAETDLYFTRIVISRKNYLPL
jgi:hypothetical protein